MAATPMAGLLVLPGAPTVESAGPLLPAELMKETPRSRTTSFSTSTKRPWSVWKVGSPKLMLRMSQLARTPWASARIMPWLVSMPSRRVSPILRDTICAPGATPSKSGRPGWCAATMEATCVPWDPVSHTMERTRPPSYTLTPKFIRAARAGKSGER